MECAATGERALSKAKSELYDLILLDLMLPGIDGLGVARKLKDDPKSRSIPIVMLTAKGEEADIVSGLELGAHSKYIETVRGVGYRFRENQ